MPTSAIATQERLTAFLSRFFHLSAMEMAQLQSMLVYKQLPKNHILIREGETEHNL